MPRATESQIVTVETEVTKPRLIHNYYNGDIVGRALSLTAAGSILWNLSLGIIVSIILIGVGTATIFSWFSPPPPPTPSSNVQYRQ